MKPSDYISYFENIARRHKSILHTDSAKHFYRMDIDEVLTGLRTDIRYKVLILENHEGKFTDQLSDNIYEIQSGAFLVLDNLAKNGDYNAIATIQDACYQIGLDIYSWIKKDKAARVLPGIDINSFAYQKVGPLFDNAYGYRFTFNISKANGLAFDASKWNL